MKAFLDANGWAGILALVVGLNLILSGVSSGLDALKGTFPQVEGASNAIHKVLDFLKKIVDFLSANVAH